MDEQNMISTVASSPNSSMVSLKKYDVFLSFRGEDTRRNFTSFLHEALILEKVEAYIDNRLEKGKAISLALIKAIEESHISVVIFSENYASSKWCLAELSKIMDCKKDKGQVVIPVFYNIDPSHVRKQTGSYEQAFAKHEQDLKCNKDELQKWRADLTEAANLVGWDSQTSRTEAEFIKDIVRDVLQKLNLKYPTELKGLVGIEGNYANVESLLEIGTREVRMIGIWGMGGIGKTTLATALYVKLHSQFEGHHFLASVREQTERHGLDDLRRELFTKLLKEENLHLDVPKVDPHFVTSRLSRKKLLIVLDDVATSEQLEDLIKDYKGWGAGSRVIVTTRDRHIFTQINAIYEVMELNFQDSLQLFCMKAFKEKQPKNGYEELLERMIAYCKGNPLALTVLGADLHSKSKEVWESKLRKLQKIQHEKIHNVLKLSFGDLDRMEQDIFLDIVCFFKGESRDRLESLLEACDFSAASGIEVLLDKGLITVSSSNEIEIHDLIGEMGQEIVHQESTKDPGRRSRLWKHDEVCDVLNYNKGTDAVEGIILDWSKLTGDLYLSSNSFTKMTNMRVLQIHDGYGKNRFNVYLPNGLKSLSNKLRYLHWDGFCLDSLPSNFCAEQLVELHMPRSKLKKLWDGDQNLVNLKKIDLWDSRNLIEIPNLSKATNLEEVHLGYCESLLQLHPSLLSLPKVTHLFLNHCKGIESLNVHLKNLLELVLEGCSSLKDFSVTSKELMRLNLAYTSMCEFPSSIWCNRKLTFLSLRGCNSLDFVGNKSLNDLGMESITRLNCMQYNASNVWFIQAHLDNIDHLSSLAVLDLSGTNVVSLPENIKNLSMLTTLKLDECGKLVSLPEIPPCLKHLSACNCTSLDTDFTQWLVLQHMLQSHIPYSRQHCLEFNNDVEDLCQYFFFPIDHVTDEFKFQTEKTLLTIPYLPKRDLCGFIYCISFNKESFVLGEAFCSIYEHNVLVSTDRRHIGFADLCSDHVLFWYHDVRKFNRISVACDYFNNISFEFKFNYNQNYIIERCGVFPVYASESVLNFVGSSSTSSNSTSSNSNSSNKEIVE